MGIKKGLLRYPMWRKGERLHIRIYSEELILHSICGACFATGLQSRNSTELIAVETFYCVLLTETIYTRKNFRNVDRKMYFSIVLGLKLVVGQSSSRLLM